MSAEPGDSGSDYVDQNIAKAVAHEGRALMLAELNSSGLLSPKEFAARHELPVSNVSYHFRRLEELGCAEVVQEQKVRGSTEHFYRATRRALFDGKSWDNLPQTVKERMSANTFTNVINHVADAMKTGTFDKRNERFLVWFKRVLDEQGWQEIADIYRDAVHQTMDAANRSQERVEKSEYPGAGLPSAFAFLFFQSPWLEPPSDDASQHGKS
jgi:predicted ArsR family transcriptional regulator